MTDSPRLTEAPEVTDIVETSEHLRALFVVGELVKRVRSLICHVDKNQLANVLNVLGRQNLIIEEKSIGDPINDPAGLIKRILASVGKIFDNEHVLPRHLPAVGNLSKALGAELGLDQETCELLFRCGAGHDVGKVDTAIDFLISQDRKLNPGERKLVEAHAPIGSRVLDIFAAEPEVVDAARSHHERLDGSGYPDNLPSERISFLTKVVSVADNVDAMLADRPGKPGKALSDILSDLRKMVEYHKLDQEVVEAFFKICKKGGFTEDAAKTANKIKTAQLLRECGIVLS